MPKPAHIHVLLPNRLKHLPLQHAHAARTQVLGLHLAAIVVTVAQQLDDVADLDVQSPAEVVRLPRELLDHELGTNGVSGGGGGVGDGCIVVDCWMWCVSPTGCGCGLRVGQAVDVCNRCAVMTFIEVSDSILGIMIRKCSP